jgi:hypothetical protein
MKLMRTSLQIMRFIGLGMIVVPVVCWYLYEAEYRRTPHAEDDLAPFRGELDTLVTQIVDHQAQGVAQHDTLQYMRLVNFDTWFTPRKVGGWLARDTQLTRGDMIEVSVDPREWPPSDTTHIYAADLIFDFPREDETPWRKNLIYWDEMLTPPASNPFYSMTGFMIMALGLVAFIVAEVNIRRSNRELRLDPACTPRA